MQRDAKMQMQENGIGTRSQQALKMQQEQNKQEDKARSRERKEADEQRMFELKQQKKKGSTNAVSIYFFWRDTDKIKSAKHDRHEVTGFWR